MPPDGGAEETMAALRRAAITDPKGARSSFQALLQGPSSSLEAVLEAAGGPGDGRLRQAIALVFRTDDTAKTVLEPWLRRWLDNEPDEFTRRALERALPSRGVAPVRRGQSRASETRIVEAYRYVADRLCHRIRNPLALPMSQLPELQRIIGTIDDPTARGELLEILSRLQRGLQRIARTVEFDVTDDYTAWRDVPIAQWLESSAPEMEARYGAARLVLGADVTVRRATVRATPFLLDTIFSNVWINAIQASSAPHLIEVQVTLHRGLDRLQLVVTDNGPGFSESHVEAAFEQAFSTKSGNRGRGLLEIGEAVARLQGEVALTQMSPGDYRLKINLPAHAR